LWVPVGNPALIGLDLPITAVVGVGGRRRKILTRAKLERLLTTRLIRLDPKATKLDMQRLQMR
jgi:hypothetical protein